MDATQTYLPESAIRIGDHVYLAEQGPVHSVMPGGALVRDYSMQATSLMEFDCAALRDRILLTDTYRSGRFLRLFESGSRSYMQAVFRSEGEPSFNRARLKAICAFPLRRERLVNLGYGDGDTLLQIDTRSVRDYGTTKSVWARIDYPKFTLNPPYGAPYDSVRELITLDCTAGSAQVPIRYYFSPAGEITDATKLLDPPAPAFPIESDPLVARVAHAVCGAPIDPEHFTGPIGGDVIRVKPETPEIPAIEVGPISDDVRASAAEFSRALPGVARFSKATVVETSSSTQYSPSKTEIELRPQTDGTTLLRESYSIFYVDRVSVGGFAQLRSRSVDNTPESSGSITEQLSTEISAFAEGATFNYRRRMRDSRQGVSSKDAENCRIGKPVDAATLNATLAGRAWQVECVADDGSRRAGYYVEALRYFLATGSESSSFGNSTTHIDSVTIER
ncbi:hypothetical protein BLA50215_04950 [Burkholderia lata]|uniref:surface-adhesin E family protein n=1 Tax=Burkholderia lata (strain ATCC 17760 / DSM 23089 / LMG 22485 / NCIMB 9086 / R18194 / 383) TaxID=482957 RepID=UPI00145387B9|nr:surface-adhesin E family protein [Burkholderia lata]VWD34960.1 hypothetical protein BLA50215_04950 [Burkholderia lata]